MPNESIARESYQLKYTISCYLNTHSNMQSPNCQNKKTMIKFWKVLIKDIQ